ncbi:MAG: immunoglobulin-like domain-containing protein, partial [Nitrososphaerales archaeon]
PIQVQVKNVETAAVSGDTIAGCNLSSLGGSITVYFGTVGGVTFSPIIFTQCSSSATLPTTVTVSSGAVSGTYNVAITEIRDASGNLVNSNYQRASAAFTLEVIADNTPPVVTLTPDRLPDYNGWYNSPVTFTVSGTDASGIASCDQPIVYLTPDSFTASVTGSCTDNAGNVGSASTTFQFDDTAPVITLIGANPLYLQDDGVAFTDPGVTVTDNLSGPNYSTLVQSGTVDTSTPEVYTRTYNIQDDAGNSAVQTRDVVVIHINFLNNPSRFNFDDQVYVVLTDFYSWRNNQASVDASIASLLPGGAPREQISPIPLAATQNEGIFTNPLPVTLVVNDNCYPASCQEPLLTVQVDDDVKATYRGFDTVKVRVSDQASNSGIPGGITPRTTDTVRFAESDRYQPGGTATVKVNDPAANTNSGAINSVSVQITSTQDATGFALTLNEDSVNSGTFTAISGVTFTSGASSSPAIKAVVGDTVYATYGANQATAIIIDNDNIAFASGIAVDINRREVCPTDADGDGICDSWETASGLVIPSAPGIDFTTELTAFSVGGLSSFTNGAVTISQGANSGTATFTNSGTAGLNANTELSGLTGAGLSSFTNGAVTISQGTNAGKATFTQKTNAYTLSCTAGATMDTDPTGLTVCPSTGQKDVYLEIDYMTGHQPNNDALNDVKAALKALNIRGIPAGPVNGINLHRLVDDSTPHQTEMLFTAGAGTTSFLSVKKDKFGTSSERSDPNAAAILTAKRQAFHWAYFGHNQAGSDRFSSGLGEKPGNDFWITLGEFTGKIGTRGQQAGTILHEVGHNFGFGHGGTDETNCKANYRSVMNYLFQFDSADGGFISGRPLTYSSFALSAINELALREDIVSMTTQSNPTVIGGGVFTAPSTYT